MSAPAALEPGVLSDGSAVEGLDEPYAGRAATRVATAPRAGSGRHARNEPVGRRERRAPELAAVPLDLEDLSLPEGEATPEEVEALADQMLLRLAVSEPKQRFLDPDEVPGGKWALAALGTVFVVSVLMIVYTVLGTLFGG